MIEFIRSLLALLSAFILQVAVFPAVLADPFRPNLLLIAVVWISLTASSLWGASLVYLLGLAQDSVSGLYLGLNGFNYLITFLILHSVANRLYAESRYLMTLAVFTASVACGLSQLLLLALFSSAGGIVGTLLTSLIPQGLVNALAAACVFSALDRPVPEESR